jgi:hypothetical protein
MPGGRPFGVIAVDPVTLPLACATVPTGESKGRTFGFAADATPEFTVAVATDKGVAAEEVEAEAAVEAGPDAGLGLGIETGVGV